MAQYQEEVMQHVKKFSKRIEKKIGNLARHTQREEVEIADMRAEVKMLKAYADTLPVKSPDLPNIKAG